MIIQSNQSVRTVLQARIIRIQGWHTAQHFAPLVEKAKFLLQALTHNTIVHIAASDSTSQAGRDAQTVRPMHGRLKAAQHCPIVNATMAPPGQMEARVHNVKRESTRTRGVRGVLWSMALMLA